MLLITILYASFGKDSLLAATSFADALLDHLDSENQGDDNNKAGISWKKYFAVLFGAILIAGILYMFGPSISEFFNNPKGDGLSNIPKDQSSQSSIPNTPTASSESSTTKVAGENSPLLPPKKKSSTENEKIMGDFKKFIVGEPTQSSSVPIVPESSKPVQLSPAEISDVINRTFRAATSAIDLKLKLKDLIENHPDEGVRRVAGESMPFWLLQIKNNQYKFPT